MLKGRILSLTGGSLLVVLCASHAHAQVACMSAQGSWTDEGGAGTWNLNQASNKSITGYMVNNGTGSCPGGYTWAVTGRMGSQGGDVRLVATFFSPVQRPETCAQTIYVDGTLFKPGCNKAAMTFTNSGNLSGSFGMGTSCKIPNETTPEFVSWNGQDKNGVVHETLAIFRQELTPGSFNYGGRYVQEYFQADAVDTCYRVGNIIPELKLMPVKPRIHLSDQAPAAYRDTVGMHEDLVNYFRQKNISPCGYYLTQRMRTDCDFGEVIYKVNDLVLAQGAYHVESGRGPTRVNRPWGAPPPARAAVPIIIQMLLAE